MLIQSLTITPAREKKEYKGANRAIAGLEYLNPTLTFAFEAFVSERTGLCDTHPGTAVVSLANFAATRFGFDPAVGTLVFEDPSATQNLTDSESINFTVAHYPFVTA